MRWISLFVACQTLYAMYLNSLLYQRISPFFDSMSYTQQYAAVLTAAREGGILVGLKLALHGGTVSLPWIFTALFSPVLPYSRQSGIWFQEIWMLALGLSVFFYLTRYRRIARWRAVCLTLPFLAFRGVFEANGGVSDFRMDLMLYLLLANMAVWYLATYETDAWGPWALSGVFLLLATLNRATAPVYMTAMFVPVLAARVVLSPRAEAMRVLRRVAMFWVPPAAAGVAALAVNYEYLHYYYFVWGADPNAHLPLAEALSHVVLAGYSIGPALTLVLVPALALELWNRRSSLRSIDAKLLWIGSAPVLMLVLRGAGLNPFVQMPAVFGWMLFAMLPFHDETGDGWRRRRVVALLVVAACAANALNGVRVHLNPPGLVPGMQAVKTAIQRMHDDALSRGRSRASFATAHIVDFEESVIRNVLVFEFGALPHGGDYFYRGVAFRADDAGVFNAAVPLTWQAEINGSSDQEKIGTLVNLAEREIDYFFLLDDKSLGWAEKNRAFNFINTKTRALKQRLLATGRWEAVGDPLVVSPYETVVLYRKR